ncbi:MAG: TrkA C-terminal domain-containing protein [Candidatus Puniceispirillaceae bacterium]
MGAILRGEQVIAARGDTVIEEGDHVILFARHGRAGRAESILSESNEYF